MVSVEEAFCMEIYSIGVVGFVGAAGFVGVAGFAGVAGFCVENRRFEVSFDGNYW